MKLNQRSPLTDAVCSLLHPAKYVKPLRPLALVARRLTVGAMCLVAVGGLAPLSYAGIERVWAVDDGEKVKRDDLTHWAATSNDNPVWDGSQIRIAGARNEVVAFQLILESTSAGASQVDVRLDSLRGPGYVIANRTSNADPFDYVGRHIELFLEHYVNITQRSATGGSAAWAGARSLPDEKHLGWIPDALIPFQATPGTADWIGGAPFQIGPARTQAVWVDITIPRQAPPGSYRATVRVSEQGSLTHAIPLDLEVYDFTLPDSTNLHNMFHVEPPLLFRHPGITANTTQYWDLFRKYMHLAHRHRMDLTDGRKTLQVMDTYLKGYYTGESYTQAYSYDGPGRSVGNTTYSIGTYDQFDAGWVSGFDPATRERWWAAADAWEEWFQRNAPEVVRFKYMKDEPDQDTTANYAMLRERAAWIHSNPGPGKALPVFCTVKLDPRLVGAIDFWSLTGQSGYDNGDGIPSGYVVEMANQRRARGEKVGIYNGTRPAFGIFQWIDNFATDPRVIPWIAWKYDVDQYFLWETGFLYNQDSQPKKNPWVTPFFGTNTRFTWGLGTVLYTGNDNLFPEESRGIDGPIASIRIKNWRRGQQDYEYLVLAEAAGIDTRAMVDQVVPAAFDDYNGTTYTQQGGQPIWAQRGYLFEQARTDLAALLEGTPKTELPTGSFVISPDTLPEGGGTVTLQWTSANATSAVIDQGIGTVPLQGSRKINVSNSTTFRLTLANQGRRITLQASAFVPGAEDGDTSPYDVKGDVNADGAINQLDVMRIQDHILRRRILVPTEFRRADVAPMLQGDGRIDLFDQAVLQEYVSTRRWPWEDSDSGSIPPQGDWHLISVPRQQAALGLSSLFPGTIPTVYHYDQTTRRYQQVGTLEYGVGYWALFPGDSIPVMPSGADLMTTNRALEASGFVLIGSLSSVVPLSDIQTDPEGSFGGYAFRFDAARKRYEAVNMLTPGEGHWIVVTQPCTITIRAKVP